MPLDVWKKICQVYISTQVEVWVVESVEEFVVPSSRPGLHINGAHLYSPDVTQVSW